MPTIHAAGAPASARLTTLVRSSGVLQAAVAATPAARSIAIPPHIGTCASASSTKVGAAALAREPSGDERAARRRSARAARSGRAHDRSASATTAANGAARIRSCPACGDRDVELGRDAARIGDITSTPAWLANSARNSTTVGDASSAGRLGTAAGASEIEVTDGIDQRWPSPIPDRDGINPRVAVRSTERRRCPRSGRTTRRAGRRSRSSAASRGRSRSRRCRRAARRRSRRGSS